MSTLQPKSSRGVLSLSEMYAILNDLEVCTVDTTLCRLKTVMNLLEKNPEMCIHFCKLGGVKKLIQFLASSNYKITEFCFFILALCANNDKEARIELSNERIFDSLSRSLKKLEFESINKAPCVMFLLMSIISGSGIGQTLARESMCQHHLVVLFHRLIQEINSDILEENKFALVQTWTSLCLTMSSCIDNPQNKENQHQLGLILPKALIYIENWFNGTKCLSTKEIKESIESLLTLLTLIVSNNESNQLNYSLYRGVSITISAIALIQDSNKRSLPNNASILEKLIHLLDASVSENASNCALATAMGAVPVLIKQLQHLNSQLKIAALITLSHLVEANLKTRKEFERYNGISAVALAMVNTEEVPQMKKAANCLLQYCTQQESTNHDQRGSHSTSTVCCSTTGSVSSRVGRAATGPDREKTCMSDQNESKRTRRLVEQSVQGGLHMAHCHQHQIRPHTQDTTFRDRSQLMREADMEHGQDRKFHTFTKPHLSGQLSQNTELQDHSLITHKQNLNNQCLNNIPKNIKSRQNYLKNGDTNSVRSFSCRSCNSFNTSIQHSPGRTVNITQDANQKHIRNGKHNAGIYTSTPKKQGRNVINDNTHKENLHGGPSGRSSVCRSIRSQNSTCASVSSLIWKPLTIHNTNHGLKYPNNASVKSGHHTDGNCPPPKQDQTLQHSRNNCHGHVNMEVERCPFSEEEIANLSNGVFKYGMNFKAILAAYKFHPSRSSADLFGEWKSK